MTLLDDALRVTAGWPAGRTLLRGNPAALYRDNVGAHLTASTLVVHPDRERVRNGGVMWRKKGKGCPILLKNFRSIASSLLKENKHFAAYVEHFLGHAPRSMSDKHYAAPAQNVFDEAMDWQHGRLFGR